MKNVIRILYTFYRRIGSQMCQLQRHQTNEHKWDNCKKCWIFCISSTHFTSFHRDKGRKSKITTFCWIKKNIFEWNSLRSFYLVFHFSHVFLFLTITRCWYNLECSFYSFYISLLNIISFCTKKRWAIILFVYWLKNSCRFQPLQTFPNK